MLVGRLAYFATCILLFVAAIVRFASGGAFGAETTIGVGRTLAAANAMMALYVVANVRYLAIAPVGIRIVSAWLLWVLATCLHFLGEGLPIIVLNMLSVSYCPLTCLFFFCALRRRPNAYKITILVFLLLLGVCAFLLLAVYQYRNLSAAGAAQLNPVYYVLLLLPWALICPRVWWRYTAVAVVAYGVVWSMKRTAFVALVGAIAVYFLCEHHRLRRVLSWRWLAAIVFVSCTVLQMWSYVNRETSGHFLWRFSTIRDDRGSGRLDIYKQVVRLQASSTIESWIFGHGHDGVRQVNAWAGQDGKSAHNDWQETLYDYGLPGLLLYTTLHGALLAYVSGLVRQRSYYGSVMAASYVLFFVMSLVSHLVLYSSYFSYLMAFWGVMWALSENDRLLRRYSSCLQDGVQVSAPAP